jgi:hypothetical protein
MSEIADSIIMLTGAEYRKMMAEIAASNHFAVKYLAHIDEQNVEVARLTAENEKLRAALQGVLWMAEEWFKHDGSDATFDDDYKQELDAARATLSGDKHE